MKMTMTKTAMIATMFVASLTAKAQNEPASGKKESLRLSIGAESGIGIGSIKNTHRWSVGGSVQAELPLSEKFTANVNAGYLNIFKRDGISSQFNALPDIQLLPVTAGIKFFPIQNLYVQANAGAAFALNKSDLGYNNSTAFLYVPQIGYQFGLGHNSFIDAGIRYQGSTSFNDNLSYSKINQFGLRIAYSFGL